MRALATTHSDLVAFEVDVLDAQAERLAETETGAVEELTEEAEGRFEVVEQGEDVAAREDGGEVIGPLRALETFERGDLHLEDLAVQEDQRAEGLVLSRSGGVPPNRQVVEKRSDLGGAHLARVTPVVEADELTNPAEVGLLGARRVVEAADRGRDGFKEGHGGASSGVRRARRAALSGATWGRLRPDGRERAGGLVRELGSGCLTLPMPVMELGSGCLTLPMPVMELGSGCLIRTSWDYSDGWPSTTMLDSLESGVGRRPAKSTNRAATDERSSVGQRATGCGQRAANGGR